MDLNNFSEKVNLDSKQVIANVQELSKKGYVCTVGTGYGLTPIGRGAIKAFTPVSDEQSFHFYTQIGYPTVYTAKSLGEFYKLAEQIGVDVLEFHTGRGDFENWIREVFCDEELADEFLAIRNAKLREMLFAKKFLAD
jgi:hypothetical protein